MSARELILLSPYRPPSSSTVYLGDDEAAAYLNGFLALWHPAALHGAAAPPRVLPPYDAEQPAPGAVYAVPASPPLLLPDDWWQRVEAAGARAFKAGPDRDATLAALRDALARPVGEDVTPPALLDTPPERQAPFR